MSSPPARGPAPPPRAARGRAQRAAAHRTRELERPGPRTAPIRGPGERGLRLLEVPEARVREALDAHARAQAGDASAGEVLKSDHRARITAVRCGGLSIVVKEVVKKGLARRLADCARGSPARRAWRGGHGLAARGVEAAQPLAYLERRRLRVPTTSWVLLRQLAEARPLSDLVAERPAPPELLAALLHLLCRLHATGVHHGDLQAQHVYVREADGGWQLALIDLESVRFRRRLAVGERLRALAELNASLPDAAVAARARRAFFERYEESLPLSRARGSARRRRAREAALRRIVVRSLARRHEWRGLDCPAVKPSAAP